MRPDGGLRAKGLQLLGQGCTERGLLLLLMLNPAAHELPLDAQRQHPPGVLRMPLPVQQLPLLPAQLSAGMLSAATVDDVGLLRLVLQLTAAAQVVVVKLLVLRP